MDVDITEHFPAHILSTLLYIYFVTDLSLYIINTSEYSTKIQIKDQYVYFQIPVTGLWMNHLVIMR